VLTSRMIAPGLGPSGAGGGALDGAVRRAELGVAGG
jgi:hypothetical protein